ncbi:Hypothetical protein NTJ_04546 [Nesidiocoris tenuis]|nr:Hypothetical protein NTJ_04546 [Nesidiocoris tenuis]
MYHFGHIAILVLLFNNEGDCLDCFVCHSRQNPDCGDPFPKNDNSSGQIVLYECDRVRKVGEGLVAASNAMGGPNLQYAPLDKGPHHCYKITIGEHAVRGCGKSDFCRNMSEVCETCNSDGCNSTVELRANIIICVLAPLFCALKF